MLTERAKPFIIALGALLFSSAALGGGGFVVEPAGQATGSTCQSYALAVALATKNDAVFKIHTAADLRKAETAIRAEIKKLAGTSDVTHAHVQSGFEKFTGGKYTLKFKDVPEPDIGTVVGQVTGIKSAAAVPPSFLLGAIVKDVILASASKIGPDTYNSGHIFTIYGVDGPPNSNRRYLILNSGVKIKDKRFMCEESLPDDPGDYSASLTWKKTGEIAFKPISGDKIRLWTVEKGS
jgi:hypothetical protein